MVKTPEVRSGLRCLAVAVTVLGSALPLTVHATAAAAADAPATGDFAGLTDAAEQDGSVRVIVELKDAPNPTAIREKQEHVTETVRTSARVEQKLTQVPAMVVEATPTALERLRTSKDVKSVALDHANALTLSVSTTVTQASTLWSQGVTGLGTNVAIIDTGVDTAHPMLSGKVTAEACFTVNACPNGTSSQVGTGAAKAIHPHGTHVATTAAGRAWTAPNGMNLRGVAPDARVIAVQVFQLIGGSPIAYDSSMLNAIDWVVRQRSTTDIAALNLSIGGGLYSSQTACDAARPGFAAAFLKARTAGIAPVVAAGNNGSTGSMSGPGCASNAISVAAVGNDTFNQIPAYSNVASWTSLFAPGGCGPSSGRAVYAGVPGAQVAGYCGTSMATPHVTGAFALLHQKRPTLAISTLLQGLQSSGATVTTTRAVTPPKAIRVANALTALATVSAAATTVTTTTASSTTTTTRPTPTTTAPKPAPRVPMPKPKRVIVVAPVKPTTPTTGARPTSVSPPTTAPTTPTTRAPQPVSVPVAQQSGPTSVATAAPSAAPTPSTTTTPMTSTTSFGGSAAPHYV